MVVTDIKDNCIVFISGREIEVTNLDCIPIKEIHFDESAYNAFLNKKETRLYCCFSNHVEVFETKEWKKTDHIKIEINDFTIFAIRDEYFIGHKRDYVHAYNFRSNKLFDIGEFAHLKMHGNIIVCSRHYDYVTDKRTLCAKYWYEKDPIIEIECNSMIHFNGDQFLLLQNNYVEIVDWDGNLIKRYPLFAGGFRRVSVFCSFVVFIKDTVKVFDTLSGSFIPVRNQSFDSFDKNIKTVITNNYVLVIVTKATHYTFDLKTLSIIKFLRIIAAGLFAKKPNTWTNYLTKGLYDPRIFLHVARFF